MGFINWLGVGMEILGLGMSGLGLLRTWHEFAPTGEHFLGPLTDPARAALATARDTAETWLRRVVRRPKAVVAHAAVLQSTVSVGGRLGVKLGYGKLSDDPQAALAELHRRTQQLMDKVTEVDERVANEQRAREHAEGAIGHELTTSVKRLEQRGQQIAVGGVRTQAIGLVLVALGLFLQVMAVLGICLAPIAYLDVPL